MRVAGYVQRCGLEVGSTVLLGDFSDLKIKIRFSERRPNIKARDNKKIIDTARFGRPVADELGVGG